MDLLVVEGFVLHAKAQPPLPAGARERYLATLTAD
jgi:hypothetical protein